ncbi:MAG TPA: DUF881 domain-containing protein [bacterium]|nr:DUF881 domain-containing protein [bacterium]
MVTIAATISRLHWPSWVRARRLSLTAGVLLAAAGWGFGAAGISMAVHEHERAGQYAALAGFTPVYGPGVGVTLSDSNRAVPPGSNPSTALVQDSDLTFLVMMLWYGGARAIAINGERVTTLTTITSSGPTLLINGHRQVGPFEVVAVGDPRVLRGVLETQGGFAERMRQSGLGVRISPHSAITVPAGRDAPPPLF